MRLIWRLLYRRTAGFRKIIRNREGARLAVAGTFVLLFALVMVGEYVALHRAFVEVIGLRQAGAALTLYILESFLLLVLMISVASFVVSGLWVFYRSTDTRLLLASPLPLGKLFGLRVTETVLLTSWALVVLGIPGVLALGAAYRQGLLFYLAAFVIFLLFAALAAGLGTLLTTLAGMAFRRFRTRTGITVSTVVILGGFAVLAGATVVPSSSDFYAILDPGSLNGKPASIKFIETKFWLSPGHPYAASLFAWATQQDAGSPATRIAFWLAPLALVAAAALLGRRLFGLTLPAVAEGLVFSGREGVRSAPHGRPVFPRFFRGAIGALVERDLVGFGRSPHELGRAAFLLFLLVLYTAFLFVTPFHEVTAKGQAVARLYLLNLLAAGYILTAFCLRFVFPSFSLEGRAAWILFSSPVPIFPLFLAKLGLHAVLLLVVVSPIAMAGTLRLVSSPALIWTSAALLILITVTTVTVSLSAGAIWPNFREPNPESQATSVGGLAATFTCLGYVAAVGWMGQRVVRALSAGEPITGWLAAAGIVSAAVACAAIETTRRKLNRFEVA